MEYEFYINTKDGDYVWHWGLEQWQKALEDLNQYKDQDDFRLEIQVTKTDDWDTDISYVEIYPVNESAGLPKYVQKYVNKVLSTREAI